MVDVVFNHRSWPFVRVFPPFRIWVAFVLLVPRLDGKSISANAVTLAGVCLTFFYHFR